MDTLLDPFNYAPVRIPQEIPLKTGLISWKESMSFTVGASGNAYAFVFLTAANGNVCTVVPDAPSETFDAAINSVNFGVDRSTFVRLEQSSIEPTYLSQAFSTARVTSAAVTL
jgi:hypothetical protein